jgi:hypothetical protein
MQGQTRRGSSPLHWERPPRGSLACKEGYTLEIMTHASVTIQMTPDSKPAMPFWIGEVAAFAQVFTHTGMLTTIQEQVRFARPRFGHYDLIDFVVVLIGYTISGEATLKTFYERLVPFASPFMALFGRSQLPHRSTLSVVLQKIITSSK